VVRLTPTINITRRFYAKGAHAGVLASRNRSVPWSTDHPGEPTILKSRIHTIYLIIMLKQPNRDQFEDIIQYAYLLI
jgi:hypothetical protein